MGGCSDLIWTFQCEKKRQIFECILVFRESVMCEIEFLYRFVGIYVCVGCDLEFLIVRLCFFEFWKSIYASCDLIGGF